MDDEIQGEAVETVNVPETTIDTPQPDQPQAPAWSDEDAEEARAFGWKSPDEWVGEIPAGYIDDPKRFLERASNFTPFRKIKERLEAREAEIARKDAEFDERARKLEAVYERSRQLDRERLMAERADAVEMADRARFDAAERQLQALDAPVEPPKPPAPAADPYVQEYEAKNEWVKNPILREAGARLIDAAGLNGRPAAEQIAFAEAEVRKMYPAYFPKPEAPRPAAQRVDGGGLAGGAGRASAFSTLPSEARQAFSKFVKEGLFEDNEKDRKRYADDYNAA